MANSTPLHTLGIHRNLKRFHYYIIRQKNSYSEIIEVIIILQITNCFFTNASYKVFIQLLIFKYEYLRL